MPQGGCLMRRHEAFYSLLLMTFSGHLHLGKLKHNTTGCFLEGALCMQCPISNFISYQFLLIIRKISKVISKVEQMNSLISLRGSIICMSDIWILRSRTITFTIFSVKLKVINTHLLFRRDIKLTWLGIVLTVFKTCRKCGIGNVVLIQTYLCVHQLNEFCLILLE